MPREFSSICLNHWLIWILRQLPLYPAWQQNGLQVKMEKSGHLNCVMMSSSGMESRSLRRMSSIRWSACWWMITTSATPTISIIKSTLTRLLSLMIIPLKFTPRLRYRLYYTLCKKSKCYPSMYIQNWHRLRRLQKWSWVPVRLNLSSMWKMIMWKWNGTMIIGVKNLHSNIWCSAIFQKHLPG